MKFFSVLLSSFLFKVSLNIKKEALIVGVFKNISYVIIVSTIFKNYFKRVYNG